MTTQRAKFDLLNFGLKKTCLNVRMGLLGGRVMMEWFENVSAWMNPQNLHLLFAISTGLLVVVALDALFLARSKTHFWMDVGILVVGCLALQFFQIADSYTGMGVNDAVWYHLKLRTTGVEWGVVAHMVETFVFYTALFGAFVYVAHRLRLRRVKRVSGRAAYPKTMALMGVMGVLICPTTVQATMQLVDQAMKPQYQQTLLEASVPVDLEVAPRRPKSVVYVYAESLEGTFMDETRFPGLMPHLSALQKEALSLDNIDQAPFTSWTIAGIVASQCGFPDLGEGMNTNAEARGSDMHCVGDILKHHGYTLSYLNGADIRFAGKDYFFQAHGFDRIQGKHELVKRLEAQGIKPEMSKWGLYDDDLLSLVDQELDRLLDQPQPFFLSALTLDTHPPEGHTSAFCKDVVYGDGQNLMLNHVHCADRMLGAFVRSVRQRQRDDVIVVLASDHLQSATSSLAHDMLKQHDGQRRNLWMAWGKDIAPQRVSTPATMFDVGPTLLPLMGFDIHSLRWGRDVLGQRTLMQQWGKRRLFASIQAGFDFNDKGMWTQTISVPDKRPLPAYAPKRMESREQRQVTFDRNNPNRHSSAR